METPPPRKLVIPLLAIIAISLAAATLTSPTAVGGIGTGDENNPSEGLQSPADQPGGPGFSISFADGPAGDLGSVAPLINLPCFEFLADDQFLTGALITLVILAYILYKIAGVLVPIGLYVVAAAPVILLYRIFTACVPVDQSQVALFSLGSSTVANATSISLPLPGLGGAETAAGTVEPTSVFLFILLGVGLLIAIIILYESTGDDVQSNVTPRTSTGIPWQISTKSVESSQSLPHIENSVIADNKIYQAWKKMTEDVDISRPNSSGPREYARKAIEEGKHPGAVERLTALFEETRYGTKQPSPESETEAEEALEEISRESNEESKT